MLKFKKVIRACKRSYQIWFILGISCVQISGFSQIPKVLTLQECIKRAVMNSPQIKQGKYAVEENENQLSLLQASKYPTVDGILSHNFASGRIIDPFTNIIGNQNTFYQNWSLNSSVTLYNGGAFKNNIAFNEKSVQLSESELNRIIEDIKLKVIEAFFQVLNAKEQLEISTKQFEVSKYQLTRLETLLKEGMVSKANYLDLKAQIISEELNIANAEEALEVAKISLMQAMNESNTKIEAEPYKILESKIELYDLPLATVLQKAISTQAVVEVAKRKIELSNISIDLTNSLRKPVISANLNIGTNFSSDAPAQRFISDGKPSKFVESKVNDFVLVNGQKQNLVRLIEVPSGSIQDFGYGTQLGANLSSILGMTVRMPIYNGAEFRIKSRQANLTKLKAVNELSITQIQLKNTVELAYKNMQAAFRKLNLTNAQLTAYVNAFELSKKKFEEGNLSSLEFALVKNNIDKIRLSAVQAKYEYLYRTKVLDYYVDKI